MKKSSELSCKRSENMLQECFTAIPGLILANRSVTTSFIYCKTPDGRSLRIGDHKGREKYSYKWNLNPTHAGPGRWVKDFKKAEAGRYVWRYYTGSVADLAEKIAANVQETKRLGRYGELPY
jgi:hypothetical protein